MSEPRADVPECACPTCGHAFNDATGFGSTAEHEQPEPGDISICIACASFLRFNDDLSLRMMTEPEVGELSDHTRSELMRMRRVLFNLNAAEAAKAGAP